MNEENGNDHNSCILVRIVSSMTYPETNSLDVNVLFYSNSFVELVVFELSTLLQYFVHTYEVAQMYPALVLAALMVMQPVVELVFVVNDDEMVLIAMVLVDIDWMVLMVKHLLFDFLMLSVFEFVVVFAYAVHFVSSTQNMYLRTIF